VWTQDYTGLVFGRLKNNSYL